MRELSLNVLDIAQNSIAAAATQIQMEVVERTDAHTLTIGIYDNGCGMTDEQVKSVLDPFYTTRTTRKVGMGVPLFKMAAEQTGGSLTVSSKVGIGTNIKAVFHTDSVDFTPLGDMASTVTTLVSMNTEIQFLYRHKVDKKEFVFDTAEIREILGDVPLSEPAVVQWMREFIEENTKALYGGVTE
ncbi:MAG: ATP-binding protein [Clostridia bacterium]|nr:ATP-binding protein [Clostridia bacterium]